MAKAIQELLAESNRYIITIRRANRASTEQKENLDLVLDETDNLDFSDGIDSRLLRSRRVIVILVDKNSGVAKVDLTKRSWEVWQGSNKLRESLISFNRALTAGAQSRWITAYAAWLTASAPLSVPTLAFTIWSVSSSASRKAVYHTNSRSTAFLRLVPHWLNELLAAFENLWPVLILVSALIGVVIVSSGGLRVWPRWLNTDSLSRTMYQIRSSTFTLANVSNIIIGVAIAVIASAVTFWFSRH
jgi:hypothetical protein